VDDGAARLLARLRKKLAGPEVPKHYEFIGFEEHGSRNTIIS